MVKGKKTATNAGMQLKLENQRELEHRLEVERLKQLESSSSTISDTDSTESYISFYEASVEEATKNILETLCDSDTESLQEEEPDYLERKTLLEKTDFFVGFREVPNVDNISQDISVASIAIEKTVLKDGPSKDTGKFVNPLTGQDIRYSVESVAVSSEDHKDVEEVEEEQLQESLKDISQDSELLIPVDALDLEEDIKRPTIMEDTFEAFLEYDLQPQLVVAEEINWEALAREEEANRLQANSHKFLNELINKAVEIAEYASPERILQQNLDKRKLLIDLANKFPVYYTEKSCCGFLNRQIVQHFRRKKSFRSIMEDNPKTLQQDKQKLNNAKTHLDEIMAKEMKLLSSSKNLHEELKAQYEQLKEEGESKIKIFESKVRKQLGRDNWPKMNVIIDQLLLRMNKYRNEVSEVRFALFLQQHTQARLTELLSKLEDLGNGLNMNDFSNLQAETQALDKKIEERNAELNKLYTHCRNDLHTLAHYRQKQEMLCSTITIQSSFLDTLVENKSVLRERLHVLKLKRNRLHAQIKKLSAQGGLLDKPVLMFDYDNTVERGRQQKEIVNNLRGTLRLTQRKIDEIVKQYLAKQK
ncbi:uncharacterized protein LOC135958844 [Calliphora vicina]|uniref:uncharacterized protein LOC135958844 n=1 Tax=Calliphora vicina TaxID=7373 RepID=UPI00325A68EA